MSSAENLNFKHWKDKPVAFKIKGCLSTYDQISFCCQIDFMLQLSAQNEKCSVVNILFKFSLLNESLTSLILTYLSSDVFNVLNLLEQ